MKPDQDTLAALRKGSQGRGPITANDGLCKAARIFTELDEVAKATLEEALLDPDISSRALHVWLSGQTSRSLSVSSVQNHRANRCACR